MAAKLKRLLIDRVDLVDKGANPDAHILLFKRDASLEKMDMHGTPLTTQEILDHEEQCEAWRTLRWAFMDSLDSIMEYATPEEQGPLLLTSVEEFAAKARQVLGTMGMADDTYKRATEGVTQVEKAGRVIAGQRLQRLKQAVMALQNIITEAEPSSTTKGTTMAEKAKEPTPEEVVLLKRAIELEAQVTALQEQGVALNKRVTDAEAEAAKLQPVDPWAGVSAEVRKRIESSEERVAKAETEVRKRDCITQVRLYKSLPVNPDDDWEVMDHINTLLPDTTKKRIYALFSAADEGMRQSGLFKAQGTSGSSETGGSAYAVIEAQARELVTKGTVRTIEQGIDRVMQERPDLYAQYEAERRGA